MNKSVIPILGLIFALNANFSIAQDPTSVNPNNANANVHLSWSNDVARIRVGGTGIGSTNGFDIQTQGDNSLLRLLHNGNIGIGTQTPNRKLTISGQSGTFLNVKGNNGVNEILIGADANGGILSTMTNHDLLLRAGGNSTKVIIKADGKVGVGTIDPSRVLEVAGDGNIDVVDGSNAVGISRFRNSSGSGLDISTFSSTGDLILRTTYTGTDLIFGTRNASANYERVRITAAGDVGIGTTTPDAKLTVKGDIHTREVRVDLNGATGPDYVFEEDYDLWSLEETEQFIRENKHLPEIPSAAEMEKDGIELKKMNLKLLQKVEELTLHLIRQEKEIAELKSKVAVLEER